MTQKNPWPIFLVKILGFLKRTTILGQHFIKMSSSKTPVKILGYFIRTMLVTPKNPWPTLLVKILGFSKSAKTLGLHCIKISGLTPVEILGYFLRTRFLTPKTHCLYDLSKSCFFFFFFKE